ncbi:hypothetical protein MRX96_024088 [Rhipicephalus microplus]
MCRFSIIENQLRCSRSVGKRSSGGNERFLTNVSSFRIPLSTNIVYGNDMGTPDPGAYSRRRSFAQQGGSEVAAEAIVPPGATPVVPTYVPPAKVYEDDEEEVEEIMRPQRQVVQNRALMEVTTTSTTPPTTKKYVPFSPNDTGALADAEEDYFTGDDEESTVTQDT